MADDGWAPVRAFEVVSEPLPGEVFSMTAFDNGERYRIFAATEAGVYELAENGSWSKIEACDGR